MFTNKCLGLVFLKTTGDLQLILVLVMTSWDFQGPGGSSRKQNKSEIIGSFLMP